MARILHYLDTDGFAGTEMHVLTLMKGLSERGEKCALVCRQGTEFEKRARSIGTAEIFAFASGGLRYRFGFLRGTVSRWRPDIIHAHNGRTSLQAALLARPHGPFGVMTQHFVEPQHTHYGGVKRAVATAMHRWVNGRLSRIIAVSEAARTAAIRREGISPDKIVTVYNGVEVSTVDIDHARRELAAMGVAAGDPVIITVARLSEEKDHALLLQAVPEILRSAGANCRFVWLGAGPLEDDLRSRIRAARLGKNIVLPGFRSDARDLVGAANLFVLPCSCESFGLALVEAMVLGIPSVAMNSGGPVEILVPALPEAELNSAAGWLVPPGDVAALARAVIDGLCNPKTPDIAERGKRRALANFTVRAMAEATKALYSTVLESDRV